MLSCNAVRDAVAHRHARRRHHHLPLLCTPSNGSRFVDEQSTALHSISPCHHDPSLSSQAVPVLAPSDTEGEDEGEGEEEGPAVTMPAWIVPGAELEVLMTDVGLQGSRCVMRSKWGSAVVGRLHVWN